MPPSSSDLRAYVAGTLSAERFAVVDAWLAALPDDEAARVLDDASNDADAGALRPLGPVAPAPTGFASEMPRGRLRSGLRLGEGGMAVVETAHDRVLDRTVALKVLRPRDTDESLEHYHLREAAFRREAALTAKLEHPAIPPIYDVGYDSGQPAFAMRRLDGRLLDEVMRNERPTLAERVAILLRVADAISYAHSQGVVHRDVTPHNILIGPYGAVYVLDWGLAAPIGTVDGVRAGTAAWMAPEQADGACADPRLDVFGLGAVACFIFTGYGPRPDATQLRGLDFTPLSTARVPFGLAALVRRCCADDPHARYADAGAVADDLRRWLADGVTVAQGATRWELAWLRLRRSPRARSLALSAIACAAVGFGLWRWHVFSEQTAATARLDQLAATDLNKPDAVALALDDVRAIRVRLPHLESAAALEARLTTAQDVARHHAQQEQLRARLNDLLHRTRLRGPWTDRDRAWTAAIHEAGLRLDGAATDVARLRIHPLREALTAALPFVWRSERERGADAEAVMAARLLADAGPTPGWQAMGRLLEHSRFAAHDPVFCVCDDTAAILSETAPTATALALFAPEPRLTEAARAVLHQHPGDFWPLIATARASLADDPTTTARLALIASGAEPDSTLPPLLLAYAALRRGDDGDFALSVKRCAALDPDNVEVIALRAVLLAREGDRAAAQATVDRLDPGHLQYHLHHAVGHPMEYSVQAIVAAGLHIADAPVEQPTHDAHRHH